MTFTDRARLLAKKWALDRAWPLVVLAVVAVVGLAIALGVPDSVTGPDQREIQDVEIPRTLLEGQLAVQDTDRDGLADALENYVYGTDPENPDSSGTGMPDGYLAYFGYHPLEPGIAERRVAEPPASALPDALDGKWPGIYQLDLRAFYELTRPADYVPGEADPWWEADGVASPNEWDANGDGISDAWFVVAGLPPFATPLDQPAPGTDDPLTVRENWELGTNPALADTDGDGIDDADEPALGLDPLAFSTLGAGVADGWLVALGLDPLDASILYVDPDRDGLTTAEEFRASFDLLAGASIGEVAQAGLDPFDWQTAAMGIPDGWLVVHELDPLDPTVASRVTERASDYAPIRFVDDAPDGQEPLGDLQLTVRDEYAAARPESWDERIDGVWWGGTSPATNDTDADGLPDVIEVRGWYVEATLDKGPGARSEWFRVTSDPSRPDSDGDGLTDLEEYRGRADCGDAGMRAFPPTHPGRTDTAFSGLTDHQKVCGFELSGTRYDLGPPLEGGLDPTKADSDGDLLADGAEARYWHKRARTIGEPYPFPDSAFASTLDMASAYAHHAGASSARLAKALGPDGDWDGDGLANLLDPDSSSALALEGQSVCEEGSKDPSTIFLLDGPQIAPELYRFTELASTEPRPAADPANPDTDGDGLSDAWEVRYGRFLAQQGRWSLDPTKLSSAGTGIPDGRANLGNDVVRYFAAPDQVRTYSHDNLQECRSGTDPNVLFSDDDGVSDGWKVFWGQYYPDLVSSGDPLAGQLTPAERQDVLTRAASVAIAPGDALLGVPPWLAPDFPVAYTRFVLVAEGDDVCENAAGALAAAAADVKLADWEHLPPRLAERAPCVLTADDATRLMLPVRGAFNATYAALYGTGANPYLDDADRDEVADWFEVLIARLPAAAATAPSPLVPDGATDADADGLTLLDEFNAWLVPDAAESGRGGPDPRLSDSDLDGLSDADEVLAGFDPKDPFTRQRLEQEGGDADRDGVSDLDEIKGWTHAGQGPRFKTSPIDPDTDGDGLLDGVVPAGARRADLDRLGIARITEGGSTTYLGEGLSLTDPGNADVSGEGVPDGWQAYYAEMVGTPGPSVRSVGLVPAYKAGRPLWWNEPVHGVWWWGLPPTAPPCGDLDGDGLSDTNGEDPFPARASNSYAHASFTTTSPEEAKNYILAASTRDASRERAQAWGPDAGDPLPSREALLTGCPELDLDPLQLTDIALTPDPPVLGAPVTIEGRALKPDGTAARGATVVLSTQRASAQRALGAAFAGADGSFRIETRFAEEHTLVVPSGSIFLGTVGAEVTWTSVVSDLAVGATTDGEKNKLVVWTYNTTVAGAGRVVLERTLRSLTSLTVEGPPSALVGRAVDVNATLVDGLGRPLGGKQVTLTWDGTAPPTTLAQTTDGSGRAIFHLPAGATVGRTLLAASYAGVGAYDASQATAAVPVLRPSTLTVAADQPGLTAGEPLVLAGQLASPDADTGGLRIELTVGDLAANATTAATGAYQVLLTVPENAPAGALAIAARFAGSDTVAPAEAQTSVDVLGLTRLLAPGNLTIAQDKGGLLSGEVQDARGRGVKATVAVLAPGLPDISGPTASDGSFNLPVPSGIPRGRYAGAITVLESAERAGTSRPFSLTVRSASQIELAALPDVVGRGTELVVLGKLIDGRRAGVSGEPVVATLLGRSEQAVTGAGGTFRLPLIVASDAPLGAALVEVAYAGALDGSLTASARNETLAVKEPTRLALSRDHTPLARPHVAGTLTRAGGDPVPGAPVVVEVLSIASGDAEPQPAAAAAGNSPVALVRATTSATGTFNATLPGDLADGASVATVRLTFPGSATLDEAREVALLNLTTPLVWDAVLPRALPLDQGVGLVGRVRDAAGPAIDGGEVVARLDGAEIGSAPVSNGVFSLTLTVPRAVTPGPHGLVVTLEPAGLHADTPLAADVLVTALPTLDVTFTGELVSGKPYEALARVTDQAGRPLAYVTLVYWVEGPEGAAVAAIARTNDTGHAVLAGLAPEATGEATQARLIVVARGPTLSREVAISAAARVGTPDTLSLLPVALVALLAVAVVVAAVIIQRKRRQVSDLRNIVEELLRDLERGNEYTASVLLAYKRLVLHLESYGFLDRPEYSAREFLKAVHKAVPLPTREVEPFVALFEQARYSQYQVGPRERTIAIVLLRRIMDAIKDAPRVTGATT